MFSEFFSLRFIFFQFQLVLLVHRLLHLIIITTIILNIIDLSFLFVNVSDDLNFNDFRKYFLENIFNFYLKNTHHLMN